MNTTTLLFIDDDEDDLSFFYQAVKDIDRGIHCFLHKDSQSAMRLLETDTELCPDLIFLDLNMPKLSGKHCLSMIKHMVRHKNTPVIICTTSSSERDMDDTWELGAACYLTKPPTVSDWKYEISEILSAFLKDKYGQLKVPEEREAKAV
ncbi:MAG: response regulator [Chitinophagaceae bacterium]|nr:response regulator [Chitinophagaceae bacterium]